MSEHRAGLSVPDGVAVLVGIVIGMGIFKAPSLVAGAAGSSEAALWLWAAGGLISALGALTYAELAAAYPSHGGEYGFLVRAYGRRVGFLFGWARLTVIQTGTIAGAGFVLGDYLAALWAPFGAGSAAGYAGIGVLCVTAVQIAGLRMSASVQNGLAIALGVCILVLIAAGIAAPAAAAGEAIVGAGWPAPAAVGFAMIFVLLTFGGWNEAVYLSGEVRNPQRDTTLILLIGVATVTALYLGLNAIYLRVLGLQGVAESTTVGADLAAALLGGLGAAFVSAFVTAASLSTMNGTSFTGGRSAYALGRDWPALGWLARWDETRQSPTTAIVTQGGIGLALVAVGASLPQGGNAAFEAVVAYTAPVFWLFFMLTGLAHPILRARDPVAVRPFRTPLAPITPLLFCAAAGYMIWTGLQHALRVAQSDATPFAVGAALGLAMLAAGLGLVAFRRKTA